MNSIMKFFLMISLIVGLLGCSSEDIGYLNDNKTNISKSGEELDASDNEEDSPESDKGEEADTSNKENSGDSDSDEDQQSDNPDEENIDTTENNEDDSSSSSVTQHDIPPIDESTKQVYLQAINDARAEQQDCGSYGVKPAVPALAWSDGLYKAAYEHNEDMTESDIFSHDGSGTGSDWTAQVLELGRGSTMNERVENNGYTGWRAIGENITAGTNRDTAQEAIDAWLASDGHCSNLMNSDYTEVGLAHMEDTNAQYTHYWTQNLGAR